MISLGWDEARLKVVVLVCMSTLEPKAVPTLEPFVAERVTLAGVTVARGRLPAVGTVEDE